MSFKIRDIVPEDEPIIREIFYQAIFVPEGEDPYPKNIIYLPELRKYHENWDVRKDFGLLAFKNKTVIGAIYGRFLHGDNKGYGYIDDDIPELSMAVMPGHRNQGIGTVLLNKFFELAKRKGHKSISLSVDKRNPAVRLYERTGFKVVRSNEVDLIMRKDIVYI